LKSKGDFKKIEVEGGRNLGSGGREGGKRLGNSL